MELSVMEGPGKDWTGKVFGNPVILDAVEPYLELDSIKSLRSTNASICKQIGESGMFERKAKLVVNLKSGTGEQDFLQMSYEDLQVIRNPKAIHLKGDFVELDGYGGKIIQKYGSKVETLRLESGPKPLHVNKLVRHLLVHCPMLKRLEVQASRLEVDSKELLTRDEYNNGVSPDDMEGYFGLTLETICFELPSIAFERLRCPRPLTKHEYSVTTVGLVVMFLICPNVTRIEDFQSPYWVDHAFVGIRDEDRGFLFTFERNPRGNAVRTVQVARQPITKTKILKIFEKMRDAFFDWNWGTPPDSESSGDSEDYDWTHWDCSAGECTDTDSDE